MLAAIGKGVRMDDLVRSGLKELDEQLLTDLCDAFSASTKIKMGSDPMGLAVLATQQGFDDHFSGKLLNMYKWLYECCMWEWSDFLEEIGRQLEKVDGLLEATQALKSLNISTTSSGDQSSKESPPTQS